MSSSQDWVISAIWALTMGYTLSARSIENLLAVGYNEIENICVQQYDRAKKGAKFGILCSISIAELIGITIYTAAPVLIAAFNRDPDVIHYGVMQARTIALFYCLLAFTHCIAAVLRGSGNAAVPFIVKGIMTVKGALKAKEAGAAAIVVSNHGGRVLDQCPATAEVLEEIAKAVDGSMKIFVDGGIRSGTDVFKALALGADAVIIARPFVTAVYGGGREGVEAYIQKIGSELADTMAMCGVSSLSEITRDCVRV